MRCAIKILLPTHLTSQLFDNWMLTAEYPTDENLNNLNVEQLLPKWLRLISSKQSKLTRSNLISIVIVPRRRYHSSRQHSIVISLNVWPKRERSWTDLPAKTAYQVVCVAREIRTARHCVCVHLLICEWWHFVLGLALNFRYFIDSTNKWKYFVVIGVVRWNVRRRLETIGMKLALRRNGNRTSLSRCQVMFRRKWNRLSLRHQSLNRETPVDVSGDVSLTIDSPFPSANPKLLVHLQFPHALHSIIGWCLRYPIA